MSKSFYRLQAMKYLIYFLLLVSHFAGCGNAAKDAQESHKEEQPTDSLVQKTPTPEEIEKARMDSLIALALKDDSLPQKHIIIDKECMMLFLRENGNTLMNVPVCLGKSIGQKKRLGDHKTPEGEFKIISIEDPTYWTYDFHDGRGKVTGTYGPWFFRLNTPQSTHIGIHGTCFPESMGKRESDGCVRMRNEDLEELRKHITIGMKVIIHPDKTS